MNIHVFKIILCKGNQTFSTKCHYFSEIDPNLVATIPVSIKQSLVFLQFK